MDPADDPGHTSLRDVLLSRLSLTRSLVIRMRFQDDLTMFEIGEAVGLSESRISQMLSETLRFLRDGPGERLFDLLGVEGRAA